MPQFDKFKKAVQKQFSTLASHILFRVGLGDNNIWELYLASFPEGTNPLFRERTQHDCSCCRQFINNIGDCVAIIDNELMSIWDNINTGTFYDEVARELSLLVHSRYIENVFMVDRAVSLTSQNIEQTSDAGEIVWPHLYVDVPDKYRMWGSEIAPALNETRNSGAMLKRAIEEISLAALDTVIELIEDEDLYRGEEHLGKVKAFRKLHLCSSLVNNKDFFIWTASVKEPIGVCRIKNSVIGTLLTDITEGKSIEDAVASYDSKMDGYKRPSKVATKGMIKRASAKVEELGFMPSLPRRYANNADLTINNVRFADRSIQHAMKDSPFDKMLSNVVIPDTDVTGLKEVSIEDFMANTVKDATSLELLFEDRLTNKLVSIIGPGNEQAPNMFQWDNPFCWSYNGEVADSIRDRVKKAGGDVEGEARFSLSWFNFDDLDLHLYLADGTHIYHSNSGSRLRCSGVLDVDMNVNAESREAVENISFSDLSKLPVGVHVLKVHNYTHREREDVGFEIEAVIKNKTYHLNYPKMVGHKETVIVGTIHVTGNGVVSFNPQIKEGQPKSKEVWGLNTQTFHRVTMIMDSPNFWDGQTCGNKHIFFTLKNCINPEQTRGFYNEFLAPELYDHRKVFEHLAAQMKTPLSDDQLSGLGFSSTIRTHVVCRVNGNQSYKINF